ncbi:MAG TPA: heme A synthase [Devosia sp.]|nr:heme A synthase [Devosia sp.]
MTLSVQSAIDSLDAPGPDRLAPVRIWLFVLAAAILIMVAIGGITRLTDSGLSITSWKPVSGIIPPLTDADWQAEYDAYKQIPEFTRQNSWMSVEDFKSIFWWEWSHRFFGRMIGFLFAVPFLVFLFQRRLSWRLAPSLAALFVLGGFQGFLGWWMVSSGLSERVDVSQYRLAAHLGAASLLFAAIIWVAMRLGADSLERRAPRPLTPLRKLMWLLVAMVFLQIILGAFVAGLDAGFGFNTWPLMEGKWIPDGLGDLQPAWRNLFENLLTVQFDHRVFAYLVGIVALVGLVLSLFSDDSRQNQWMKTAFLLVLAQIMLGILTLVLVVPIPLAVAHQSMALVLFGTLVAALADLRR